MRPAIQVTVALSTLLGCDEQPGELAGHGPIPATLARHIAADPTGTWRRLITDPATGALLDHNTTTYRPPANLTAFVIARDQTCTFPGCQRSAQRCDLDHQIPASAGGSTSPANLAALCRRHHRAKHQAGWQVRRDRHTGDSHWRSPTGHAYLSRPPTYPQDRPTDDPDPPPF
jgi:HNH endonuclease